MCYIISLPAPYRKPVRIQAVGPHEADAPLSTLVLRSHLSQAPRFHPLSVFDDLETSMIISPQTKPKKEKLSCKNNYTED